MGFQCVPQNTNRPTNQQATVGKLKWSEAGDWENGGEGANGHKAFGFLAAESVRWRETLNAQCAALPGGCIYIKKGQGVYRKKIASLTLVRITTKPQPQNLK